MQRIENHALAHGVETKLEITPKEPLARFEFIAKLSQQTTSTYDVFGLFEKYGSYSGVKLEFVGKEEIKWVTYAVPGVVTGDCYDSLFCGNLIAPHRNEHVGEPETHCVQMYPYALAQALCEWRQTKITLNSAYRAQPYHFEYQGEKRRTWEIVAVEPTECVSVDTVSN